MNNKETFNESLKIVLSKMCETVGTTFDGVDFSDEQCYNKCEWTIAECKMFKKWLSDYLYKNTKARRELMRFPSKRKSYCDRLAEEFAFQYGWKYCEKE